MTEKQPALSLSTIEKLFGISILVGGIVFNYAASNTRAQEVERRVSNLEQQSISRNEYTELIKRLDRIEGKVDRIPK